MVVSTAFGGYQQHDKPQRLYHSDHKGIEPEIAFIHFLRPILHPYQNPTTTITMAEGSSKNGTSSPRKDFLHLSASTSSTSLSSSRPRPKLGRASTVTWFNKSFDHAALRQQTKAPKHRQMRRQSSVSDFFQSMLSKSKSHIVGMLSGKKEKKEKHVDNFGVEKRSSLRSKYSPEPLRVPRTSTEYNLISDNSKDTTTCNFQPGSPPHSEEMLYVPRDVLDSDEQKELHFKARQESSQVPSVSSPTSALIVKTSPDQRLNSRKGHSPTASESSPTIVNLEVSIDHAEDCASLKHTLISQTSIEECSPNTTASPKKRDEPVTRRKISFHSQNSMERPSSEETEDFSFTAQRAISSAPPGQPSLEHRTSNSLNVRDGFSLLKRALVKSNSETLTTESVDQQPLAKAASDGNCFKTGPATSYGSQSNFISRITNYLFLGSVEAAYSEPLLCKYNISALLDMTNTSSIDVPLRKKTDCPCPCVDKNHFRSKLNIGIDDIEWENLEQYYDVINTFINGSRKNGGKILIFSYMGQSRAAAAAIQHLMCHYKIPYNEAYYIIKSKRPQIKVNSGFVKALSRLEKTLGLTLEEPGDSVRKRSELERHHGDIVRKEISKSLPMVADEHSDTSFPHVVRGAWLEC